MTLNPNAGRLACRTASFVSCALLAAVAAGALLLSAAPGGRAAADGQAPPKRGASPLGFVPADTLAFISIRVTDLWSHPAFKSALEQHAADLPPLQEFRWAFGVPLEEVERFTAVHLSTRGPEQELFAVTTSKPFDRQALRAAVAPDAQEIAA